MTETDRIVLAVIAHYLLSLDERLHHVLIQRQFMFVGGRLGKLRGVVLDVLKQHSDLLVLHRDRPPGPRDLRQALRLPFARLFNQFLQKRHLLLHFITMIYGMAANDYRNNKS